MRKIITIAIIAILALGVGWYLYKLSPAGPDLNNAPKISEPRPIGPDDHIFGSTNAKNTMVAYEDFQCPACANYEPILKSFVIELKDTKVVYRYFPLISLHKNALIAAYAAEAVGSADAFWKFTDLLYANQPAWVELADPTDKFAEFAKEAGVANIDQFKTDVKEAKYKDRVYKDISEGYGLNVQGTPTLYFNGKLLELDGLDGIKKQVQGLYR